MAEDPQGGPPVVLAPPTFARHEDATRYVEGVIKTRAPRGSLERSPGAAWTSWGLLAGGGTITARSGLTLGEGDVELVDQDGPVLTPTGEIIHVYNSGDAITNLPYADDIVLPIGWRHGHWSVDRSTSGGTSRAGRCDCNDPPYELELDCGNCGGYYGHGQLMPKIWWITITNATDHYGYYDDCLLPCNALNGVRIQVKNTGGCTWSGGNGDCIRAELTLEEDDWKITITDRNACVFAVLWNDLDAYGYADPDIFNCCGQNTNWQLDPASKCDLSVSLDPDPCTCCPDATCPPPDEVVCKATDCCIPKSNCTLNVTVNDLVTIPTVPPGEEPLNERCGGMHGTYPMAWSGDCKWAYRGNPGSNAVPTAVVAELTLSGRSWRMTIVGADGQTATFENNAWDCNQAVDMTYAGGTCPSTFPAPSAHFTISLA